MTLKLPTEKQRLGFYGFAERYIIGSSPIEKMCDAVRMEYETGITPLVLRTRKNNNSKHMEAFGSYMVLHCLNSFIGVNFDKSPDGCSSDIMVNIEKFHELYMGIQVKTTTNITERIKDGRKTYHWAFQGTDKSYSGYLMYMKSLEDGKSWLIPYNIVKNFYKGSSIKIPQSNMSNLNWDEYIVSNQELSKKILEYYMIEACTLANIIIFQTKETLSIPVNKNTKTEHNNRKNILPILEKLKYPIQRPIIEDSPFDLILGQLKLQEKTALNNGKRLELNPI